MYRYITRTTPQLLQDVSSSFTRYPKGPYTLSVKLSDFIVWRHNWRKNWVNCAVLTGLRTVLSSRLSHRKLRSSLRESHNFLSLPADTTMAKSQGTSVSSNSFSRWYIPFQIPLPTPHFTLSFLLFSFRITLWPMWYANSKQQPFFKHHNHTHKKTHRTDKELTNLVENLCCGREHSVQFFMQFLCTVKLHSLT